MFRNAGLGLGIGNEIQDKIHDFFCGHLAGTQQVAAVCLVQVEADVIPAAQLLGDQLMGFSAGQFRPADDVAPVMRAPGR